MPFEGDQATGARNRRMVWGRLVQPNSQKIAQRQRVCRAPGDPALGVNAFEIADQEQSEIDPRWQSWPAHRLRIEAGALRFDEIVEPVLAQQLIQPPIKGMTRGGRQLRGRDPQQRLPIALTSAHRHRRNVVRDPGDVERLARAR